MVRPVWIRRAFATASLAALIGWVQPAWPCTCNETPTFEEAFSSSSAIFSGIVERIESATPDYPTDVWVTLRITALWRGNGGETIRVATPENEAICGVPFTIGTEYLVYARTYQQSPTLWTYLCGRTHATFAGDPDIALLGAPTPVAATTWGKVKLLYR